ncbi:MAG: hypothetical protein MJ106_07720 [Lentisphaeria bacterium]|nr:hypothetical protein [Lentisphaeria bacterium]
MNLNDFFLDDPNEKPLDHLVTDGGYAGILRSVACIGDNLDSGEMEPWDADGTRHYLDLFEYSWLSYFGRFTGNEVRQFTRGGMSTREYVESYADKMGFWDPEKACKAYVITLGTNDITAIVKGEFEFGSIDDIDLNDWHNNKKTYAGYYGTIIQRYREISPKCRIFLAIVFQNPTPERLPFVQKQQELLKQLNKLFEFTYVMDFYQYGPVVDDEFRRKFFLNNHMYPAGYLLKGRLFSSYIDYVIRHNLDDFAQIALLDMPYHDQKYVW